MARAKYFTEFERDCVRIGISKGIEKATIARALKRTKVGVGQQVASMEIDGTIDQLPMISVVDEVAACLQSSGALK